MPFKKGWKDWFPEGRILSPLVPCLVSRACSDEMEASSLGGSVLQLSSEDIQYSAISKFLGKYFTLTFILQLHAWPSQGLLAWPQAFLWNVGGIFPYFTASAFHMLVRPASCGWYQGWLPASAVVRTLRPWLQWPLCTWMAEHNEMNLKDKFSRRPSQTGIPGVIGLCFCILEPLMEFQSLLTAF